MAIYRIHLLLSSNHPCSPDCPPSYPSGARGDGPVVELLRDTFMRWKEAHLADRPRLNSKHADVSRFGTMESLVLSDAVLSAVTCNRTDRLSMKEDADYDPAALALLFKAIQSRGKLSLACAYRGGSQGGGGGVEAEVVWVATELEFGSVLRAQVHSGSFGVKSPGARANKRYCDEIKVANRDISRFATLSSLHFRVPRAAARARREIASCAAFSSLL